MNNIHINLYLNIVPEIEIPVFYAPEPHEKHNPYSLQIQIIRIRIKPSPYNTH